MQAATLPDEGDRTPVIATPTHANDSPLDATLATLMRMAGAGAATLLERRGDAGALRRLAGEPASSDRLDLIAETVCRTVDARAGQPHWLADPAAPGGEAALVALHERDGRTILLLLAPRNASPAARSALARAVPDLAALLRHHLGVARRLDAAEEARDAAREALDHCEYGLVVIRADHSIVFANDAGSRHLEAEDALRVRRGLLRPVDHGKAIRFEAALDGVIAAAPVEGRRARASVMLLSGREEAQATVVAVAPVRGPRSGGAAAMVYLLRPADGAKRGLETLCRLHGLSRVEGHLIAHLMDGLTLAEAAVLMQVKPDTVRSYLKQIFTKMGLRRQTDLVSLMARYISAIRGDFDFYPA